MTSRAAFTTAATRPVGREALKVDRPVQLQINQSGAWRTALRWNAKDDATSDRVLDAADALLRAVSEAGTHAKGRVATDDGLQVAILHWQSDTGWTDTGWTRDR